MVVCETFEIIYTDDNGLGSNERSRDANRYVKLFGWSIMIAGDLISHYFLAEDLSRRVSISQ